MDNKDSILILEQCMQWLETATEEQKEKMRRIYREETRKQQAGDGGMEIMFPP